MFGPMRMKFTKKELVMFGVGILTTLCISSLFGARKETPLERCEYEKHSCEMELDECIAAHR